MMEMLKRFEEDNETVDEGADNEEVGEDLAERLSGLDLGASYVR